MDERKYSGCTTKLNYYMALIFLDICAALVGWVLLIVLRGANLINMHWALVLSSLLWLSWGLFILTFLLELIIRTLRRWHRRRIVDRRVIRQAKAAGVWDNPKALGGRALELYVWKNHKLKRKPGELDKDLRLRCAKKLYMKSEGIVVEITRKHDGIVEEYGKLRAEISRMYGVPVELLTDNSVPSHIQIKQNNALDELAWEDYGIKRLPGETDEQLKKRCMAALDKKDANAPDWRTLGNE